MGMPPHVQSCSAGNKSWHTPLEKDVGAPRALTIPRDGRFARLFWTQVNSDRIYTSACL